MSASAYILGNIDYDRLQRVVDAGCQGERGCGATFATLMLMLGEVQFSSPNHRRYLYVGENHRANDMVMRDFYEILHHDGYDVVVNKAAKTIRAENTTFEFMSATDSMNTIEDWLRGRGYDRVFIDLSNMTRSMCRDVIYLAKLREI